MRLGFVSPDGLSTVLFCQRILQELLKIDEYEVSVIMKDEGLYRKQIEELGVKCIPIEMRRFISPIRDLKYCLSLVTVFRKMNFDVVFNFTTKPNMYGSLAARWAGVPTVFCHVVGLGSAFVESGRWRDRIGRHIVRRLYRHACSQSCKVWFTNPADVEFFKKEGMISAEKVVLTKNYLDVEFYSPARVCMERVSALKRELGILASDQVVIMVARMIWPKGIREYVEAAEALGKTHPRVHFLLVAPLEPDNPHAVPESYVREHEKVSNLQWLGFRSDIRELFAVADLAVLPSYYMEGGYPRGLLEAMAMGKPVVTTDTPGCRGVVEEGRNGYLIPARNSSRLAEAIEGIVGDKFVRERMGEYSRMKAEREFSEQVVLAQAIRQLEIPRVGTGRV